MKKLVTCSIAVAALIGTPAFAADMGVPAAPLPAPVYNWTGWYVGVNAGASMGKAKTDFNGAPGFLLNTLSFATPPGFVGFDEASPGGFIGGGQIGYNWQYSPLIVVGLEADFQGALEKDSNTLGPINFSAPAANGGNPFLGSNSLNYAAKIEWFGTARARIGYVWGNGNVLSYVTGGFAYGKVDVAGTSTLIATNTGLVPFSVTQAFGHNAVNTGWTIGYGTEGVIDFWGARNWTWRVESYYMDLGHLDTTGPGASTAGVGAFCPCVVTAGPVHADTHFTDWILRGGISYKFN
jgi:outer membrane immunogenic protein